MKKNHRAKNYQTPVVVCFLLWICMTWKISNDMQKSPVKRREKKNKMNLRTLSQTAHVQGFLDFALFLQVPFADQDEWGLSDASWFCFANAFKKKRGNRVAGMDTALYTHILLTLNKWNKEVVITSLPWRWFFFAKKTSRGGSSQLVRLCQPLVCLFSSLKNSSGWKSQTKKTKNKFSHTFSARKLLFLILVGCICLQKSESMHDFGKVHRHHSPMVGYSPGFSGLALIRLQPWISMTFKPTHFQPLKTPFPWEEAFFVCIPRDVSPIWRCVCFLMNVFEPNKFVGWMYSKSR